MAKKAFARALITGASQGLGRALALECAARGMDLLLAALPGERLPELAQSIARARGVAVDWLEADFTEVGAVERLVDLALADGRGIDLLVNNAGIGTVGPFEHIDPDYLDATIRLNASVLVRLTRLLAGSLARRGGSQILNVASLGAFFPMPTLSVYSATKSLVLNFSLAAREELSGRVGVSVLCPNAIRTTEAVDDYVGRFGLLARMACLRPERIAREALDGAERDRAVIVPGAFNRVLLTASRIVPRALAMKAISGCWGGFEEAPDAARRSEGSATSPACEPHPGSAIRES
jgi:Short-chain dehydrogenases of various substrate specificities